MTEQKTRKISPAFMQLMSDKRKLATLLNGVLIYFSGNWNEDKERDYTQATAGAEPTTKSLCDAIRRDLKATGFQPWEENNEK